MHWGGGAHASVPIYSIIVLLQQSIMFSSDSGPHAEEIDIYVCTWTLIIHLCLSYTHMFPRTYVCVFHTLKKFQLLVPCRHLTRSNDLHVPCYSNQPRELLNNN